MKASVAQDLGKTFAPRDVILLATYRKRETQKVMRRIARAAYLGEKPGDTSALENPAAVEEIARVAKKS